MPTYRQYMDQMGYDMLKDNLSYYMVICNANVWAAQGV